MKQVCTASNSQDQTAPASSVSPLQEHIVGLVQQALKEAGVLPADISCIAYTKVGVLPVSQGPKPYHFLIGAPLLAAHTTILSAAQRPNAEPGYDRD